MNIGGLLVASGYFHTAIYRFTLPFSWRCSWQSNAPWLQSAVFSTLRIFAFHYNTATANVLSSYSIANYISVTGLEQSRLICCRRHCHAHFRWLSLTRQLSSIGDDHTTIVHIGEPTYPTTSNLKNAGLHISISFHDSNQVRKQRIKQASNST